MPVLARALGAVVLFQVLLNCALGDRVSPTCTGGDEASCVGPAPGQRSLAACTIFRDEDRFLREWLAFHLCTGARIPTDPPHSAACSATLSDASL